MSAGVAALRGTPPAAGGGTVASAARAETRARRGRSPRRGEEPLLPPYLVRTSVLLLLVLAGSLQWMQMLEPAEPRRAWAAAGTALAGAVGLGLAGRVRAAWLRAALGVLSVALMAFVAFVSAGFPDELLAPRRWGELAAGVAQGVEAIPGVRVPYRGLEEWIRLVVPLGATALAALATALACWPRRRGFGAPLPALVVLLTLYATPSIALGFESEFTRGALLALLVLAFLRGERLRRRDAPAGVAVVVGAAGLGLLSAPALDRDTPWWDYETWALSAAASKSTQFTWDHEYGPLDWPRDGREVLRVRARLGTYWKAANLDVFDGRRWVSFGEGRDSTSFHLPDDVALRRSWTQTLKVTVRNLRSQEFIVAGVAEGVRMPGRGAYQLSPGLFQATRTLRRGDAYEADVYTPKPTAAQLRDASADYDEYFRGRYLSVLIPVAIGPTALQGGSNELRASVSFPAFADTGEPVVSEPGLAVDTRFGAEVLAESSLGRTWELAQRLKRGAPTPYAYIRRVARHLRTGYEYTEQPPEGARDLDGFLFDARAGYCQQFSGAMALLLRMGGIPARVSAGFSPGSFDEERGEFVVRDLDAHSWVEAWFPGYGWVPFDPTPSSAPPRSQARSDLNASAAFGDANDLGTSDRRQDPVIGQATADAPASPWPLIAAVLVLLGGVPGVAWLLRRRRARRRPPRGPLAELERALARAGRPARPGTTLSALEAAFAHNPPAAGYLRAVRGQRFGPDATPPTAEQRRGLRAELARGAGVAGRMRALWALPPRRLH